MADQNTQSENSLNRKIIVVTGGTGVLCASICHSLASEGARMAILDINTDAADALAMKIKQSGSDAIALACDVCVKDDLEVAAQHILQVYGRVDMLINGTGGNSQNATTRAEVPFFDIPENAIKWVVDLN
jgi:NAD(P)-dependent dehydrogenase (short-subunit alcohol dehydrogenase family)